MNKSSNFTIESMKTNISKAGNLFYQYRSCKRDAATIYDIENIRHGVVFARTPLQMNDPFDSKVGFSTEAIYEECIDLVLDQIGSSLDVNTKLIIKSLLINRIVGKAFSFINVLNQLKKYILQQCLIAHVPNAGIANFISRDLNRLYKKSPAEIKRFLNKESFFAFAIFIKDYQNVDIEEKTIVEAFQIEEILQNLEETVEQLKKETYLPFLNDFLSKLTVTCFSASGWDNQLMWSHYANSYSGICVEYDFSKMNKFIGFMCPVGYSSRRPVISLNDLGLHEFKTDESGQLVTEDVNIDAIFNYLLTKNKCWEYEAEWRIINVDGKPYTPLFIEAPFVKSITLGLDLDEMCKQLLWDVCNERQIECFQLIINDSDYTLTRELLTEQDFPFDEGKDAQYVNFIAEHIVPLFEKISASCDTLTKSMEKGAVESNAIMNLLKSTLISLSDLYFLKTTFNRLCANIDTPITEIIEDTEISIAIDQIDVFLAQSEIGIKSVDGILTKAVMLKQITPNEYRTSKELIANITEMYEKHRELKWY